MSALCPTAHKLDLAAAEARCLAAGEQLTPLRRKVLELLCAQSGPAKAYDLLDALKRDHAAAKPPTIYRALDFLVRLGFAHRVESLNAYIACAFGHDHAPALVLLCDRCGRAEEQAAPAAVADVRVVAAERDFAIERLTLEAHGVCASCRNRA